VRESERVGCSEEERGTDREQEVCHVLLYGFNVWNDVRCLAHAFAFPGEYRLINAEATGRDGEQSAVGRDSIANRNGDYIAWDELGGMDAGNLAGSKDFRFVGGVFLESLRAWMVEVNEGRT